MSALLRAAAIATAALAQVPVLLQPEARPAVVIGQVTDAAPGRGVRQSIVRLAGAGETLTRVADERGRFFFRGLPAGCVREGTGAGRARPPGRTSEKRRLFANASILAHLGALDQRRPCEGTALRAQTRDLPEIAEAVINL